MSDFWGCLKLPKQNPIENMQIMMYKHLLGVQKQTTNIGVLLELGKVSLHINATKLAIKNWERIKMGHSNEILQSSYGEAESENLNWISSIRECLEKNGLLDLFLNNYENKPPFIHLKIFQSLSDQFHQNAFEKIRGENSKLRTYSTYKEKIGLETYLNLIKNPSVRTEISKFRLSNHKLMIEIGRHKKIPRDLRFCQFCPNEVETEKHFLLHCSTYKEIRKKLITDAGIKKFLL